MWLEAIAWACLTWYFFIVLVGLIGSVQIFYSFNQRPSKSKPLIQGVPREGVPHVTIIRPCKGIEPYLYECLAATFHQDYPKDRLSICFCISTTIDPAYPVLQKLVGDCPQHQARIYVEEDDPQIRESGLGPNPKIRNMSRAYREAKGDIVWILDCNVWVERGACGRMVDKLCGFGRDKPYKFVHHVPVAIAVRADDDAFPRNVPRKEDERASTAPGNAGNWGGRLEELFLSSAHAKFYTAINTVGVAPCINGKSNMFRRSHLNYLTSSASRREQSSLGLDELARVNSTLVPGEKIGLDHFSENICEDHIIGELLWHGNVPSQQSSSSSDRNWGKHALILNDLAFQPIANMSLQSYVARRVRWLRVRKFTVILATLVEPGTESLLCSAYGAFGCATLLARKTMRDDWWTIFSATWLTSVVLWATLDWFVSRLLRSRPTLGINAHGEQMVPFFSNKSDKNSDHEWLLAWLGRELLALPIWIWAFWGGTTVVWRDRKFWVGMDMKVHEIVD